MQEIIAIKSPLKFLINEGVVNTSLSFVASERHLIGEMRVERIPSVMFVSDKKAEIFKTLKQVGHIITSLRFPLSHVDINTGLKITESISKELKNGFKTDWFIQVNYDWLINQFNIWFEGNMVANKKQKIPTKRDLYSFLSWVKKSNYKRKEDIIKNFNYRTFW